MCNIRKQSSRKSSELLDGRTECDGVEKLVVHAELEHIVRALQQADLRLQELDFEFAVALLDVGRGTQTRASVAFK